MSCPLSTLFSMFSVIAVVDVSIVTGDLAKGAHFSAGTIERKIVIPQSIIANFSTKLI